MDNAYYAVAPAAAIPAGCCRSFTVAGVEIVIAHLADGFYAMENRCSHAGGLLDPSRVYKGREIACPLHGARFDLKTGAVKTPPAFRALKVFPVRVSGGIVEIDI